MTCPRDDAPPTTSKHGDATVSATESLIDAKGSSAVAQAVTISGPVAEVYAYFRDFANLPRFMEM